MSLDGLQIVHYEPSQIIDELEQQNLPIVTYEDFTKICRTCLSISELNPISDVVYGQSAISEILQTCIAIQFSNQDGLPQSMCSPCLVDLIRAYNFKQKCQQAEKHLLTVKATRSLQENEEVHKEILEVKCDISNIGVESDDEKNNDENSDDDSNTENDIENYENNDTKLAISHIKDVESEPKYTTKRKKRGKLQGPPFKCKDCTETCETREELIEHRKTAKHPETRNHTCNECFKTFTSSKLRQHMRTHTKEKPYKCKICLQAFSMSGNLKRHMMTHTGERPHVCDVCGKGFIQATTLTNHMRTHANCEVVNEDGTGSCYFCNFCGRSFKRVSRFNAHQKKHLTDNFDIKRALSESDASEKDPEYVCEICSKTYKTKHLLKAHQLTHGEKSFLCSDCGKGFVTKAALLSHLKVHTGEKPHTCNICQKSFAHVGSFDAHILIHTGHKPYNCTVCTKSFTQLSHLKYHLRTHSGERPYICTYCNKSFALKGNLTVHIRIHTGETPYLCPICGKGFYDSSSMKKHRRAHGDIKVNLVDISELATNSNSEFITL